MFGASREEGAATIARVPVPHPAVRRLVSLGSPHISPPVGSSLDFGVSLMCFVFWALGLGCKDYRLAVGALGLGFKPSLRSSPVTPPIFRPLGQPETRFADENVVTQ
jgi:hypothetical protein